MTSPAGLDALRSRQGAVRQQVTDALRNDDRVVAAWLSGSFGRGVADAWSDLDLHVAVADEAYGAIVANPHPLFELAGEPLLVQAGWPSDSMPGGRFWLVVYDGPMEIDWNVGPISQAVRADASVPLFEKAPISGAAAPEAPEPDAWRKAAQRSVEFFWAMAPIAVKYAGRGKTQSAVASIGHLEDGYTGMWRAVHHPEALVREPVQQNRPMETDLDAAMPSLGPVIDPKHTLEAIEAFCRRAADLHDHLEQLGVGVPTAMPEQVDRLLAIARQTAEDAVATPNHGRRR